MRESRIEAYFVKRVKEAGGLSFKFVSPGVRGVPDRIAIFDRAVYFVELKATDGKPRPDQLRMHARMRAHGADVRVIFSKEDVDKFIGF